MAGRTPSRRRRRILRHALATLVVAVTLTAAAAGGPALAQVEEEPALAAGTWTGTGSVAGPVQLVVQEGIDLLMQFDVAADFTLDVEAAVSGTWQFSGTSALSGTVTAPGAPGAATLSQSETFAGDGIVSGSPTSMTLGGESSGDGLLVIAVPEGSRAFDTGGTSDVPPITIDVVQANCYEAVGAWVPSVAATFEAVGHAADLRGTWTAVNGDPDAELGERNDLDRAVADLAQHVVDLQVGFGALPPEDGDQALPLDWDTLTDAVDRTVELTNELRNLSDCDAALYDDEDIATFFTVLGHDLQVLVALAVKGYELAPSDIRMLMAATTQIGMTGEGAPLRASAEAAEADLQAAAQEIVAAWTDTTDDPDLEADDTCSSATPCLIPVPDLVDTLVVGAQNGWTFQWGDRTDSAADMLSRVPDRFVPAEDGS